MFISLAIAFLSLATVTVAGDGTTYEVRETGKATIYGFVEEMNDGMVRVTPDTPWMPAKPYYRKKRAVEYDAESGYHRQQRIEEGYATAGYVRVQDVNGEERWIAREERDFSERAKAMVAAQAATAVDNQAAAQPPTAADSARGEASREAAGLRPFAGHIALVVLAVVVVAGITKTMILTE